MHIARAAVKAAALVASLVTTKMQIFGGDTPWKASQWHAQDDSVRGGKSHSTLTPSSSGKIALFHGNLDTKTLGVAGFANQISDVSTWDLSSYSGINILFQGVEGDDHTYTLTLKDTPPSFYIDPVTGVRRENSSVIFEFDFKPRFGDGRVERAFVEWTGFRRVYRGREVEGEPLKVESIRRWGIMIRSFFGQQEGDFSLNLESIAAVNEGSKQKPSAAEKEEEESKNPNNNEKRYYDEYDEELDGDLVEEKISRRDAAPAAGRTCAGCVLL